MAVNMSHCSDTCRMPIMCSRQIKALSDAQHRTIGHCSTITLNMAHALDVAPRNRNHGDRPTDERER